MMIVASEMTSDLTTFEESLQSMQDIDAPLSLDHDEARLDLPTQLRGVVPKERNTEATLAVDEADDPLRETWPFLLIVRTERIFTYHASTETDGCDDSVPSDSRSFQHLAGFTLQDHSCEGQSPGTISGGFTLGPL